MSPEMKPLLTDVPAAVKTPLFKMTLVFSSPPASVRDPAPTLSKPAFFNAPPATVLSPVVLRRERFSKVPVYATPLKSRLASLIVLVAVRLFSTNTAPEAFSNKPSTVTLLSLSIFPLLSRAAPRLFANRESSMPSIVPSFSKEASPSNLMPPVIVPPLNKLPLNVEPLKTFNFDRSCLDVCPCK